MAERYWVETLGCPKNQVDSDKLAGTLAAEGLHPASSPEEADVVVVNTCAFIDSARQESIDTILALEDVRRPGARLVVTGCLAERYGAEVAAALPEVDLVAGFGVPLTCAPGGVSGVGIQPVHWRPSAPEGPPRRAPQTAGSAGSSSSFDLLNLPRPRTSRPWAYLKIAEGCDRRCGFCAIPSFRGKQRSRSAASILDEVGALGPDVREVVLVAQDLASWGLDRSEPALRGMHRGRRPLVDLIRQISAAVERVRLLYLYPSALDEALVDAIVSTGVAYFDLSLQHVSRPLLQRMRRWGEADRFLERIAAIRRSAPDAALRSSFILGYPGETEEDHDQLLQFLREAQLDWAGFFPFSLESGTYAADLDRQVPPDLALQRLRECGELQDTITADRRSALVGTTMDVLVDRPGVGRSPREAPEIDGVVLVPETLAVGAVHRVTVNGAAGPDLWAAPVSGGAGAVVSGGAAAGACEARRVPAGAAGHRGHAT